MNSSKIKVLVVSHTYVVGVNQQKIAALARVPNLEVGLVAPISWRSAYGEVAIDKQKDLNYRLFTLKVHFSGNNDRFLFDPVELFRVIRRFKPELIQIEEEPWSASCMQVAILARTLGSKSIFFTWENLKRKLRPPYQFSQKSVFSLSSGAIAGNTAAEEVLRQSGFTKPVSVIPQLGVDLNFFKKRALPKEFTVGYIGRLDEQKGLPTLLEAYKSLKKRFRLLIVGTGPLEKIVQELIKADLGVKPLKGFNPSVELITDAKHDQIPNLLKRMSVLVLPSVTTPTWKEQFGHVLIEAMAAGCPVIGSSSGAIPEVIEDAGLIFPEKKAEILAAILDKLQKNEKLLEELAKKGYQRVKENYTHEIITKKTFEFYQKLLK